jgi:hypothetical protein
MENSWINYVKPKDKLCWSKTSHNLKTMNAEFMLVEFVLETGCCVRVRELSNLLSRAYI